MAAWADERVVDVVGLSEHHSTEDGYLPAPLVLAGAIAARTQRVLFNVSALLVPLHDPLRLAEDIAVIDLLSRGRFTVTVGLGYRPEEYRALGKSWERRGDLLDEGLAMMRQAWTGEPFEYRGRQVRVRPIPFTKPHPFIAVGGNSKAAARRAARFGLAFSPAVDDEELAALYREESLAHGNGKGFVILPQRPSTTFIAEDPERAWRELGEYMLYDALAYGAWRHPTRRAYAESFASNLEELRAEGKYRILTPEQAIQVVEEAGSLHLAPLVGGTPPALGWKSLELFEAKVEPFIRG